MVSTDEVKNPAMDAETTTVATATLKAAIGAAPVPVISSPAPAVAPEPTEDGVREKPPMEDAFVEKIVDEDTPVIKVETTKGKYSIPHISTPSPSKDMSEASEYKKKSGLRMYLASLTARNNAKKEYLASLEESNRAKKQLLTSKKNKNNKKEADDETKAPSTVAPVAVVAPAFVAAELPKPTVAPLAEEKKESLSKPPSMDTAPPSKPDPVTSVPVAPVAANTTVTSTGPSSAPAGNTDIFSELSENLYSSMKPLEPTTAGAGTTPPAYARAAALQMQEDEATQRASSWNCCAW